MSAHELQPPAPSPYDPIEGEREDSYMRCEKLVVDVRNGIRPWGLVKLSPLFARWLR